MFGLFEETLGLSVETGYDWTQTASVVMDEAESVQQNVIAPPGRILYIEQVIPVTGHIHRLNSITRAPLRLCCALIISSQTVGHCDGNDAQTELFNIYDVGQDGKVSNQKLQRHFKNGTVVDL